MRRNAARVAFACIVGTLFVSLLLLSRTDVDRNLQTHERHQLEAFGDKFDDPVLHRRKVIEQFRARHQGPAGSRLASQRHSTAVSSNGHSAGTTPQSTVVSSANRTGWSRYFQYAMTGDTDQLWPVTDAVEKNDRILNQLHHVHVDPAGKKLKKILLAAGLDGDTRPGQSRFVDHECPVNQCSLTGKMDDAATADLILFNGYVSKPPYQRPRNQIWVVFLLESPHHTPGFTDFNGLVNWTATYRTDSTIVAPYEHYTYFANYTGTLPDNAPRDFAANKTKQVAWFVSNCGGPNGRLSYVQELQKHISVDIYGSCGSLKCSRSNTDVCFDKLKTDYRFYLAFENSNCKDYITEKLFWNALKNDVVPIVMGAPRADYERLAPPESFIHVDDFETPADLATYLNQLASDPVRYNSYFRWKGTGEYIDTKFWCRLCAMLHAAHRTGTHSVYDDLENWWRGPGVCVEPANELPYARWRNNPASPLLNVTGYSRRWTER